MTDIQGKVAVVTGGASGIGRGIAAALIEEGATVVIADIQQDVLDATAAEIGATPFRVDVTDPASVEALKDFILETFGRVDIVVNNAGVGPLAKIKHLTLKDWQWMLSVNLWGVIHGVTTFLPVLQANPEGGHIMNTGSVASYASMAGGATYNVTKHGIAALTETLDLELREENSKVHVSILAPGTVSTNIGKSSRNRPAGLEGGLRDVDISQGEAQGERFIRPITAGRIVARGIRNNDLVIATHPDWWHIVETRQERVKADWLKYPVLEDEGPRAGEQGGPQA